MVYDSDRGNETEEKVDSRCVGVHFLYPVYNIQLRPHAEHGVSTPRLTTMRREQCWQQKPHISSHLSKQRYSHCLHHCINIYKFKITFEYNLLKKREKTTKKLLPTNKRYQFG